MRWYVLLYADDRTPTSKTATSTGSQTRVQSSEAWALSTAPFERFHDCVFVRPPGDESPRWTMLHTKSGEHAFCVNE